MLTCIFCKTDAENVNVMDTVISTRENVTSKRGNAFVTTIPKGFIARNAGQTILEILEMANNVTISVKLEVF